MAIDALSPKKATKKAGAVAVAAAAGVSMMAMPAAAHPDGPAGTRSAPTGVRKAAAPHAPQLPKGLSALSWTVADAETGDILAAKNPHRRLAPASTLKTLFAITVLPKFSAGAVRRVSAADLEGIGVGSSLVGIQQGRRYSVGDLWRGVFLRSGNDAVHVLASMNGGWKTTTREMQKTARKLGARDTTVKSPDGYDTPGQSSSAYDLTVFARAGLANDDFARYCRTARARFPSNGGAEIENTNRLITGANGVPRYPGIIGVKTGYTTQAGNTLIAAARQGGRTLLVTVMNPQSGEANGVFKEASSLLNWGFRNAGKTEPVDTLPEMQTAPARHDQAPGDARGAAEARGGAHKRGGTHGRDGAHTRGGAHGWDGAREREGVHERGGAHEPGLHDWEGMFESDGAYDWGGMYGLARAYAGDDALYAGGAMPRRVVARIPGAAETTARAGEAGSHHRPAIAACTGIGSALLGAGGGMLAWRLRSRRRECREAEAS
ncbi:D-alanyl-D-alanine carboxypeptidase [Streptomyces piniterrae]|uniref:D-alanyl-D-alanine carboxypeptidase n=1 Tax=Streptomyces piniterrae TaxID=2571125 RepID=A0A4U0NR53_9ACTN|nr:D-alanyl-D-alanine carboxypeptidase [Streptomyces piniterrae]